MSKRLYVGLVGPGLVGSELLRQIHARFNRPRSHSSSLPSSFSVSLLFVATSKRMAYLGFSAEPEASLDLQKDWKTFLNGAEEEHGGGEDVVVRPTDVSLALERLRVADPRAEEEGERKCAAVLVDCSASYEVPQQVYKAALRRNISVVTPNKCFAAGQASIYESALAEVATEADNFPQTFSPPAPPVYLGEATVGAGLPVLSTVRDLLATGDRIKKIEGVFSGSLSFIFNTLCKEESESGESESGESESDVAKREIKRECEVKVEGGGSARESLTLGSVIRRARDLGFTEPDPRDDLAGVDVARKTVILARAVSHAGANVASAGGGASRNLIELSDVPVCSLVPEHLSDRSQVDVEAFLMGLESDDGGVGAEVAQAKLEGKVLRYVGAVTVDDENDSVEAQVALRAFPRDHPYAGLSGADNVFSIVTERYPESSPLVIRGPGAGAAVTAAGVFGDLLTIARASGASV